MNRYQMALGKNVKPMAYKFKPSINSDKILSYMKKCMNDGVMLESGNIQDALLNSVIIKFSKETKTPIVTGHVKTARLLSIAHNYSHIYPVNNIPEKYLYVICYYDVVTKLPKGVRSLLTIRRAKGE